MLVVAMGCSAGEDEKFYGKVWADQNNNKLVDKGEVFLQDIRIFIDENSDGLWQASEPATLTDENGEWELPYMEGEQSIAQAMPFGHSSTFAGVASAEVTQIIGGSLASISDYPFMTDLVVRSNEGHFCGSSLIAGRYVLTAAHCVTGAGNFSVAAGRDSLRDSNVIAEVENVKIHENYQSQGSIDHDIAIITLRERIMLPRVSLADNRRKSEGALDGGQMATVLGWGVTESGRSSADLLAVDLPLVDFDECNQAYRGRLSEDMICAGYIDTGGADSCQGDSGGPLVVAEGDRYFQAGVVSWGQGCGDAGFPGVYASVAYFRDWINNNTELEPFPSVTAVAGEEILFGNLR